MRQAWARHVLNAVCRRGFAIRARTHQVYGRGAQPRPLTSRSPELEGLRWPNASTQTHDRKGTADHQKQRCPPDLQHGCSATATVTRNVRRPRRHVRVINFQIYKSAQIYVRSLLHNVHSVQGWCAMPEGHTWCTVRVHVVTVTCMHYYLLMEIKTRISGPVLVPLEVAMTSSSHATQNVHVSTKSLQGHVSTSGWTRVRPRRGHKWRPWPRASVESICCIL